MTTKRENGLSYLRLAAIIAICLLFYRLSAILAPFRIAAIPAGLAGVLLALPARATIAVGLRHAKTSYLSSNTNLK